MRFQLPGCAGAPAVRSVLLLVAGSSSDASSSGEMLVMDSWVREISGPNASRSRSGSMRAW